MKLIDFLPLRTSLPKIGKKVCVLFSDREAYGKCYQNTDHT